MSFQALILTRRGPSRRRIRSALPASSAPPLTDDVPQQRFFLSTCRQTRQLNWKPDNIIQGTIPKDGYGVDVGQVAQVERSFTEHDVEQFSNLVGDHNLLHTSFDWERESTLQPSLWTQYDAGVIQLQPDDGVHTTPLVHGMLVASLFSTIFGTLVPGCVYVNQSLNFSAPVFVNDPVLARIEITKLRRWRKGGVVAECDTQVLKKKVDEDSKKLVIQGVANVWLPTAQVKSP